MTSFSCLRTSLGLLIHGALGLAPKGLQDSAQGFNPGNRPPRRRALKGRQMEHTNKAEWGPMARLQNVYTRLRGRDCLDQSHTYRSSKRIPCLFSNARN